MNGIGPDLAATVPLDFEVKSHRFTDVFKSLLVGFALRGATGKTWNIGGEATFGLRFDNNLVEIVRHCTPFKLLEILLTSITNCHGKGEVVNRNIFLIR